METIYAEKTISVTELKRNPTAILNQVGNEAVAVLNHNRPAAYLLPPRYYRELLERLEDLEDARIAGERFDGPFVQVDIDDL